MRIQESTRHQQLPRMLCLCITTRSQVWLHIRTPMPIPATSKLRTKQINSRPKEPLEALEAVRRHLIRMSSRQPIPQPAQIIAIWTTGMLANNCLKEKSINLFSFFYYTKTKHIYLDRNTNKTYQIFLIII